MLGTKEEKQWESFREAIDSIFQKTNNTFPESFTGNIFISHTIF